MLYYYIISTDAQKIFLFSRRGNTDMQRGLQQGRLSFVFGIFEDPIMGSLWFSSRVLHSFVGDAILVILSFDKVNEKLRQIISVIF